MGMVCHMDKKKASDLNGMRKEDDRSCDAINKKNPDLDLSKTKDNYSIVIKNDGSVKYVYNYLTRDGEKTKTKYWDVIIKNRVKKIEREQVRKGGKKIRRDAVVCGSFVLGADQEFMRSLSPEQEKKYFTLMYEFLATRYGRENLVSFTVHKDEGTIGAHARVMPMKDGRLCAKEVFTRTDLQGLQRGLYDVLRKEFPTLEAPNFGNTQRKHLDELTYKVKAEEEKLTTMYSDLFILQTEVERLRNEKEMLERAIELTKQKKLDEIDALLEQAWADYSTIPLLRESIREYERDFTNHVEQAYSDVFDEQDMMRARTRSEARLEPQRASLDKRIREASESIQKSQEQAHRFREKPKKRDNFER